MSSTIEEKRGSEKQVALYVNNYADELDLMLREASPSFNSEVIDLTWKSPLQDDNNKEYRDGPFLDKVGQTQARSAMRAFWPLRGPRWDALAQLTTRGKDGVLLVEAKAHLDEISEKDMSKAGEASSVLIDESFWKVRKYLKVPEDAPSWRLTYYQVCNRIAFLYFLNQMLNVPAWLVLMCVLDDPYWASKGKPSVTRTQWEHQINGVFLKIGLPQNHNFRKRIIPLFIPAKDQ